MDISKIKGKKPWYVPKGVWNRIVNLACDSAKENIRVEKLACFTGEAAMDGLGRAVAGKDKATVDRIAAVVSGGGRIFVKAGDAVGDGIVTDEEKSDVGSALASTVTALVPQEKIDSLIECVRSQLIFG